METPPNNPPREAWERLILEYLDGSLPDANLSQIAELLVNPEFQWLLAEHAIDQALLHEMVRHQDAVCLDQASSREIGDQAIRSDSSMPSWMSLAALIMVGATVLLFSHSQWRRAAALSQRSVRIDRIIGKVAVENRSARVGESLLDGERIHTQGLASFVLLSFADGTELQLSGDTIVACRLSDGCKRVRVLEGRVSASVAPQAPERPLVIQTNTASMEVVGTDLAVSAGDDETRLNVASGAVKMRSQLDGEEVLVGKGQFAVAATDRAMSARQATSAPVEWSADFSDGLPKNWGTGRLLAREGSLHDGAVTAEFSKEYGVWTVLTQNAWSEGLFRIEDDTYLNYRIKMDRPQWYQILLCVRDDFFRAPNGQPYHEYQEVIDFKQIPPGQWRTVSVPLSAFRLTQQADEKFTERPINPPPAGATAFLFQFSTQHEDRGLAIDKVWVTRGQPEDETNRPIFDPTTAPGSL